VIQNPETQDAQVQLAIEGMLDPRSQEYQAAVKFSPGTLAHHRTAGKWQPAEHLLYISSILAAEIAMGDARIIVEVPPRHGKSELISVHTPIWFLEHFPWASILLTTYAADLATGFGRRVRDAFVQDGGGFLKTRIRDDVQRIDHFLTTEGGGMGSVGIGGPITGRGAHLLLVDDYIKNWSEASSDLVLQAIWDWFITTAYTRLEPNGSCVILATRWVLNDLIGRLIEADSSHFWKVIRMPAIAEEGPEPDLLNRQPGEALWPARYPIDKLLQIRSILGQFMFSAMFQQDPKPVGETKVDITNLKEIDVIPFPQQWRWVRSWDIAATGDEKKRRRNKSDWSVGSLIGTNGRSGSSTAMTAIADMRRGRWKPNEVENVLRETAEADGPGVPIIIEQEPGSAGKAYAQHLATNVLRGYTVRITPPAGENKWIRAQPYLASVSHGRVMLLKANWNTPHKDELKVFPNGKNDDTVDSAAQGYNDLHQTKILSPVWGRSLGQPVANDGIIRTATPSQVAAIAKSPSRSVVWGRNR
jgi:predicted phage terminase large subunit-like protein